MALPCDVFVDGARQLCGPALLVPGLGKCGTNALSFYLGLHPWVRTTNVSEVMFDPREVAPAEFVRRHNPGVAPGDRLVWIAKHPGLENRHASVLARRVRRAYPSAAVALALCDPAQARAAPRALPQPPPPRALPSTPHAAAAAARLPLLRPLRRAHAAPARRGGERRQVCARRAAAAVQRDAGDAVLGGRAARERLRAHRRRRAPRARAARRRLVDRAELAGARHVGPVRPRRVRPAAREGHAHGPLGGRLGARGVRGQPHPRRRAHGGVGAPRRRLRPPAARLLRLPEALYPWRRAEEAFAAPVFRGEARRRYFKKGAPDADAVRGLLGRQCAPLAAATGERPPWCRAKRGKRKEGG